MYLESFPVLIGNLLPAEYEINGKFDFNSFYQTYLLKMSVCAEKIIIYLTPFVLGINLDTVLFEDKEKEVVKTFSFAGKSQINIDDSIFVLNRVGHYEIVFNFKDNQKYGAIYRYYMNNVQPCFIKLDPNVNSSSNNSQNNQFIQQNQQNQQNNYNQQNYSTSYPQCTRNTNYNYQTMYNPQTNLNMNPQSARNTSYPQQMYGGNQNLQNVSRTQMIQNNNALNQNNYNTNYNQTNYYSNNNSNNPNYNNNYNNQSTQKKIGQSAQNNNHYQNKELNRANSQQIDTNNKNNQKNQNNQKEENYICGA